MPIIVLIYYGLLHVFGAYTSFRSKKIYQIITVVFKSSLIGFLIFGSSIYILKIEDFSRSLFFIIYMLSGVTISLFRVIVLLVFRHIRNKGYNTRHILLVGTGHRAQDFIDLIESHHEWGYKIVGLIDDYAELKGCTFKGYCVIGQLKDIPDILHNNVIDEIIYIVPGSWLKLIEKSILFCEIEGVKVNVAVDIYQPKFYRRTLSELNNFPFLTFDRSPNKLGQLFIKRLCDIIISSIILVLFSPVYLIISLIIKATSKGPVFFRQERCGLNGRRFTLYKFRTMVEDADIMKKGLLSQNEMEGPVFKIENDPRITKVGGFLRKTSLDEFPQFWNVFLGDMSIIGPRPPIPSEVDQYDAWHRRRLKMRPGISCLWQIKGRNKITDFNDWARMDMEFIDNWSFWLDTCIFLKTIPVVLFFLFRAQYTLTCIPNSGCSNDFSGK